MSINDRFREFLNGTTCYQYKEIFWKSEDERFAIFKHISHPSYIDRMTGSKTCPVYYALYDIENIPEGRSFFDGIHHGGGHILMIEGRWKMSNWEIIKDTINEKKKNG